MHKLKRAAAVAAMVGGIGLAGGGVASAGDYDDPYPHPVIIDNLQVVECDQAFEGGSAAIGSDAVDAPPTTIGGDVEQNVGNFCAAANVEGD